MKKRGNSQIDWAISLGMFLLFLAWFFILVRPVATGDELSFNNPEKVKQFLEQETKKSVSTRPLFVFGQKEGFAPVIINHKNYALEPFSITDKFPYVDDGKRYFFVLPTKNKTSTFTIMENVTLPSKYISELQVEDDEINTAQLEVMGEQFIESVNVNGVTKVSKLILDKQLGHLQFKKKSENNSLILGYRTFTTGQTSYSYVVYDKVPVISNIIDIPEYISFPGNLSYTMSLHGYSSYFLNNLIQAKMNYSEPDCVFAKTDKAIFTSGSEVVTIFADNTSVISLCYDLEDEQRIVDLEVEFEPRSEIIHHIVFGSNNPVKGQLGVASTIEGIDKEKAQLLASFTPTPGLWGVKGNFLWTIKNNRTTITSQSETKPTGISIKAKEYQCQFLLSNGSTESCMLNIQTW